MRRAGVVAGFAALCALGALAGCSFLLNDDFSVGDTTDASPTAADASDDAPSASDGGAETGDDSGPLGCKGCVAIVENEPSPTDLITDASGRLLWLRSGANGNFVRFAYDAPSATPMVLDAVTSGRDLAFSAVYPFAIDIANDVVRADPGSSCIALKVRRLAGAGSSLVAATETQIGRLSGNSGCSSFTPHIDRAASAVVADPPNVWWVDPLGVFGCEALPGDCSATLKQLAPPQGKVEVIAADTVRVYWAAPGSPSEVRSKRKVDTGTSVPPTIVATNQKQPMRIALQGNSIFWTDVEAGRVMKASINDDGPATPVADGLERPWGIVATQRDVFVTESGSGRVLRIPR